MKPATAVTLANGMRLIVAEDHAAPVAALGLWVRAGVPDEPPARRGLAHFFEHMMFRGSERFGSKEHTARITRLGGDCNAHTGMDGTVYHETFPAHGLEQALELEADRFQRLQLTPEHTDVERKVVLEELRVYENQPIARALRQLVRELGGTHPYGLDPLGRQEDLAAVTVGDLETFRRKLYRPRNVFAVVCGDVQRAEVEQLAEKHFGAWRESADLAAAPPVPRYETPVGHRALRLSFEVPAAIRLHRLPPAAEADLPALDLLTALLADGESAPVPEQLVKTTRLCVQAGAQVMKGAHGGVLAFYGIFMPPGEHAPRLRTMREICDRVAADGPDQAEFAKRIKRFRKRLAQAQYSPFERLEGLGEAEFIEGGYAKYERALEELAAVTPARISALARRLFAPENTLELAIIPEKTRWWMPLLGLGLRLFKR